jgi:hypothetical protein
LNLFWSSTAWDVISATKTENNFELILDIRNVKDGI